MPEVRDDAARQARELLGVTDLSTTTLFSVAGSVLGEPRSATCLRLARHVRLTRRAHATSAVAQLIVGTRALGIEWWSRVHQDLSAQATWLDRGTPDERLMAAVPSAREAESILSSLGDWIADDAADARWGRPIDYVDLNEHAADDRVLLPEHAVEGDELIAAFDPGARVWARVVGREPASDPALEKQGRRRRGLGTVLTHHDFINVADVGWAYAIATNVGLIHLPEETAGGSDDPFSESIDPRHGDRLSNWALEHDRPVAQECRWVTKGDVWSAYFRLGLPYSRTGEWWAFDNAASAVVDGDVASTAKWMAELK